jgi:pimeloyl-[acyl-carrier protein] methyl ester esterase
MHFLFVHGWGFDAGIWREIATHLQGHEVRCVDLGFFGAKSDDAKSWPEGGVAVGHSLGVLWLLKALQEGRAPPFRGLISVQGFDRFCPYVPPPVVASMRRELRRDTVATLNNFWRACGLEDPAADQASANRERLDEGLGWLMEWDASAAKAALACPMLALAARDDRIVPASMSEAIWGSGDLRWSESGGHVLPLSRPQWCAKHVLDFASELEP